MAYFTHFTRPNVGIDLKHSREMVILCHFVTKSDTNFMLPANKIGLPKHIKPLLAH